MKTKALLTAVCHGRNGMTSHDDGTDLKYPCSSSTMPSGP